MITIDFLGTPTKIQLVHQTYSDNGRLAIQAYDHEGLFGTITVNIPEADLEEDEVCVKVWSENAYWVPQILEQLKDRFVPTGKSVRTGFVSAPIYKYKVA